MVNEMISRLFKSFRSSGWALLIAVAVATLLSACATLRGGEDKEDKGKVAPSAQVLETQIVVRGEGPAKWHYFDINVPKAGSATLTLSNAAKTGASLSERMQGAKVTLNGQRVVSCPLFFWLYDTLDIPVELQAGLNRLGVRLYTVSGKRLSVRINAAADAITLERAADPIPVAVNGSLPTVATVTALGVPVPDAKVMLTVTGLGPIPESTVNTDGAGRAAKTISGFGTLGSGSLRATVVGSSPPLVDTASIAVVTRLPITLDQIPSSITVQVGAKQPFAHTVNFSKDDGKKYRVVLSQICRVVLAQEDKHCNGEIEIATSYPAGGWQSATPARFAVNELVSGRKPGTYEVETTAKVAETEESATRTLTVNVVAGVEPAPNQVVLYVPSATPAVIPPGVKKKVVFKASVSGVILPESLSLDKVDRFGNVIERGKATLKDNGAADDVLAGDLFYTGSVELFSEIETVEFFRVRFGETLVSGLYAFEYTDLKIGVRPPPDDPKEAEKLLVDDPKSGGRIFVNEVIVGFLPDVSPARAEAIATDEGATLIGFLPTVALYQLEIKGDPTAAAVREAVERLEAYDEVAFAEPNFELLLAGTTYPADTLYVQQSNMDDSLAALGWFVTRGHEKIAIVDSGVDLDHPELASKIDSMFGMNCLLGPATPTADDFDDITPSGHGTRIAGIAAAVSDNIGLFSVAGGSWGSEIIPVRVRSTSGSAATILCGINHVIAATTARILVIATYLNATTAALTMSVQEALNNGRLVVAAAGNGNSFQEFYPGAYNTDFPTPSGLTTGSNGLIAVGNTTKVAGADVRYPSSTDGSSCGDWVDMGAPGVNVVSTHNNGQTSSGTGTSMSAPLVAGAASMVWSQNPTWSPSEVEHWLKAKAASFPDGLCPCPPLVPSCSPLTLPSEGLGSGRLDILHSVINPRVRYYSNNPSIAYANSFAAGDQTFQWATGFPPDSVENTPQTINDLKVAVKPAGQFPLTVLDPNTEFTANANGFGNHQGTITLSTSAYPNGLGDDDELIVIARSLPFVEDCVGFNPMNAEVKQINGRWKIVDGNHWMFDFLSDELEANGALTVIKHYDMTQSCFIGRPDPSFKYLLVSGSPPEGSFTVEGVTCVEFAPDDLSLREEDTNNWKIFYKDPPTTGNDTPLIEFGTLKDEAERAWETIFHYGFTHYCFSGPQPWNFEYWRK